MEKMSAKEMIDDLLQRGKIEPHEHIGLQLQVAFEKQSNQFQAAEVEDEKIINQNIENILLDISVDVNNELCRFDNLYLNDDQQADVLREGVAEIFNLNKRKYVDAIKSATKMRQQLASKKEWVSCKERLPEKDVYVTVANEFGVFAYSCCIMNGKWYPYGSPREEENITHWMPLPPLPPTKNI